MIRKLLVSVIVAFALLPVYAQDYGNNKFIATSYGMFGSANLDIYNSGFKHLPGTYSCCKEYTYAYGPGVSIGALYAHTFSPLLRGEGRVDFSSYNGNYHVPEKLVINLDGDPYNGEFTHYLKANFMSLGATAQFNVFVWDKLSVAAGGRTGLIFSTHFEQQEVITNPATRGVFVGTDQRIRNVFSGTIPDASMFIASLFLGAGYELPLTSDWKWTLSPELYYHFGLNDMVQGIDWKINTLTVGVAVRYNILKDLPPPPGSEPEIIPPPPPPPPPPPVVVEVKPKVYEPAKDPKNLALPLPHGVLDNRKVTIKAVMVVENKELPDPMVKVEEFQTTDMKPLLNYVFFDANSALLPKRYIKISSEAAKSFNINQLYTSSTLPTYYHILNIIGKRMQENPDAKIILTGCNSGKGQEENNVSLSIQRAISVSTYLEKVWKIDRSRMKCKGKNLPATPSRANDKDGIEENRRVEITSDDWNIVAPVLTADTLRKVNAPLIRFHNDNNFPDEVQDWKLRVTKDDKVVREFMGSGSVPPSVDWDIKDDSAKLSGNFTAFNFNLEVTSKDGKEFTDGGEIPCNVLTINRKMSSGETDVRYDKFSLILFDFDKYTLSESNNKIVEYVKTQLNENSRIDVKGYSDRMGDSEHNMELSQNRANETAKLIGGKDTKASGMGNTVLIYDNTLPEGRFYCRTVEINAVTQVHYDR